MQYKSIKQTDLRLKIYNKSFKGKVFKHFKGDYYKIIKFALNCEDSQEILVIYKSLTFKEDHRKGILWCRSEINFFGMVNDGVGNLFPRFELSSYWGYINDGFKSIFGL